MKFINRSSLKNIFKTSKIAVQKNKKIVILASTAALFFSSLLYGCLAPQEKEIAPEIESGIITELEGETAEQGIVPIFEEEKFKLMADDLDVRNLGMTNNLADKINAATGTSQGGATTNTNINTNTTATANTGTGDTATHNRGAHQSSDGDTWASEEDYDRWMEGQHEPTRSGDDDDYYWEDSHGFDSDDYYRSPEDGSLWSSRAEYEEYLRNQEEQYNDDNYDDDYYYDDNYDNNSNDNDNVGNYEAPDGSIWVSKAAYDEFMSEQNNSNNNNEDYYEAPDGSIWVSEAAYNEFMRDQDAAALSATTSVYIEETYTDPDGNDWVSEADYLAYIELTNPTKTR